MGFGASCEGQSADRLDYFHADFSLLLGAGSADPDHGAAPEVGRVVFEDNFDQLAAPKVETSAQPETFLRGIEDQTGEPLRLAVWIDDQAGALLRHRALRATAFAEREGTHSFISPQPRSSVQWKLLWIRPIG